MKSNQRKKVGPFAPLKRGHVASAFRKEKEKEKKIIFLKQPRSSLSSFRKIQKLLPLSMLLFSSSSPPLKPPLKIQNFSSFLLQISRRSHFWSLGAHLYIVGLRISGMGGLRLTKPKIHHFPFYFISTD